MYIFQQKDLHQMDGNFVLSLMDRFCLEGGLALLPSAVSSCGPVAHDAWLMLCRRRVNVQYMPRTVLKPPYHCRFFGDARSGQRRKPANCVLYAKRLLAFRLNRHPRRSVSLMLLAPYHNVRCLLVQICKSQRVWHEGKAGAGRARGRETGVDGLALAGSSREQAV